MDEKIPFDLISTLKDSTWNLFMATLIDTPKEDGGHEKPRGKKDTSFEYP